MSEGKAKRVSEHTFGTKHLPGRVHMYKNAKGWGKDASNLTKWVKPAFLARAMESPAVALLYCHVPAASCGITTPLFRVTNPCPAEVAEHKVASTKVVRRVILYTLAREFG